MEVKSTLKQRRLDVSNVEFHLQVPTGLHKLLAKCSLGLWDSFNFSTILPIIVYNMIPGETMTPNHMIENIYITRTKYNQWDTTCEIHNINMVALIHHTAQPLRWVHHDLVMELTCHHQLAQLLLTWNSKKFTMCTGCKNTIVW